MQDRTLVTFDQIQMREGDNLIVGALVVDEDNTVKFVPAEEQPFIADEGTDPPQS